MLKKISKNAALRWLAAFGLTITAVPPSYVGAMPTGGDVRSGIAEITQNGQQMDIYQQTARTAIDWSSFNIAEGELVNFIQHPEWIAVNRVLGNDASQIFGSLQAGGTVFLINPNGVLFAPGAQVDTGGLVVSTAKVTDSFMTGFGDSVDAISLQLDEASVGKVINQGTINAEGGLVVLHAKEVENTGTINADGGRIALAAAKDVSLAADSAGKLNFAVDGDVLSGKVLNSGTISAQGGYVMLTAKSAGDVLSSVVNHTGLIEAKSLSVNEQGEILLDGGSHGTVAVAGVLDASGMEAGASGGSVKVLGEMVKIADGAVLKANGDIDGGLVETSGDVLDVSTAAVIEASGKNGKAGEWLIDPLEVIIASEKPEGYNNETPGIAAAAGDETIASTTSSTDAKYSFIDADYISWRLSNGTSVKIQAQDNHEEGVKPPDVYDKNIASIVVNSAIVKSAANEENLTDGFSKYGSSADTATLTLEAQRNIAVNAPIMATSGKLNINLHADTDNDAKGMVIMNADVDTNGGDFTAGCGTEMETGNVGIYFGHANDEVDAEGNFLENGDRKIITKGGNAMLYGDLALGLNKGKLIINTDDGENGGNIHVGSNIDSVNSYRLIVNPYVGVTLQNDVRDNPEIKELAGIYYDQYLKDYVWKSFEDLTEAEFTEIGMRCFSTPKKPNVKPDNLTDAEYLIVKGWDFKTQAEKQAILHDFYTNNKDVLKNYYNDNVKITGLTQATAFSDLNATQYNQLAKHILTNWGYDKTENRESIINRWETAELAARQGTAGGSAIGDKYLATITTNIEDWVVGSLLAGSKYEVLVGAKTENAAKSVKAGREFYWMTGPEGEANNGQGTLFYTTTGTASGVTADNMYQGWSHDKVHGMAYDEPNNDSVYGQPYVAVAWKADCSWADVHNSNARVIGFVQETNTEHSGLELKAGNGNIDVGGNIGKSVPLQAVDIKTNGTLDVGGGINPSAGTQYTGKVNADNDITIIAREGINIGDTVTSAAGEVKYNPPEPSPNTPPAPSIEAADINNSYRFTYDGVYEKPDMTPVEVTMYDGSGAYVGQVTDSKPQPAAGGIVEKVLGMSSAEMPFFKEENGVISGYGVYAVTTDPDKVEVETTAKTAVMPQLKADSQYREYAKFLQFSNAGGEFVITYNGTVLDVYPTDEASLAILKAGDGGHNVDVASQALYAAFMNMGLTLEDVEALCLHFGAKH